MGRYLYDGTFDTTAVVVTTTSALSLYNALELLLLIFTTFAVYRGLYFWSLIVATTGLIPYVVGLILMYFEAAVRLVGLILNNYGWWTVVTGQSVVLYSRLGIVLGKGNERILKYIKWMIIVNGIVFHVSTTVVVFGTYYASPAHRPAFLLALRYLEKIQMTGFCVQEFIISGLYMWKTAGILKDQAQPVDLELPPKERRKKKLVCRVMLHLLIINIVIVVLDIILLVLEYENWRVIQVSFKPFCYSVKLKLEFAVLNKLVEVARINNPDSYSMGDAFTSGNTGHGANQSFPTGQNTTETLTDPSRISAYPALTSAPSWSRPQWMEDLEKSSARHYSTEKPDQAVEINQCEAEDVSPLDVSLRQRKPSVFHSTVSPEPQNYRRARRESDLLYANVMCELAKSAELGGIPRQPPP